MIIGIKIYEIVFMFVTFAVLGYLAEQVVCIALGRNAKRGILAGPYGLVYGIGGAAAALAFGEVPEREAYPYITDYLPEMGGISNKLILLLIIALACFVWFYGTHFVLKIMSGKNFFSRNPVYPVLITLCAMVGIFQIRPFVLLLASGLPAIVVIIICVLIAGGMFSNLVDAIPALSELRGDSGKESPWVSVAEDAAEEDTPGPFDYLKTADPKESTVEDRLISTWERAYPVLKNRR